MDPKMRAYEREFISFALQCQALSFGTFTLKSGRISPYFFNTGLFNTGARLSRLGYFYAQAIMASDLSFDQVYGPAYKGIPLAVAVSIALSEHFERDVPYIFNRKEAKDHGEGGMTVGAPLQGRVLIIDDVVSAGTSVRESVGIIEAAGAIPAGVAISLDRQERGVGARSAIEEITEQGLAVVSVTGLSSLIDYLGESNAASLTQFLEPVSRYRAQYGVDDRSI